MMSSMSLGPALYAGLLYAVVMGGMNAYSGAGVDVPSLAMDGGLMGASVLINESVHRLLELEPTMPSSAAATGASFAALEAVVRGDQRLLRNAVAGAGVDVVTGYAMEMMMPAE